jgi:surface protein
MKKITEKSNSKLINGQKLTKVMAITGLTLSMASSISVIPTQTVHAEDSTTVQSNDNDLGNGLVLKDGVLHITKHVAIEGNIFDTVKGHKKDEVKSISIEAPMTLAQNSHDTFSGFKNVKNITGLENLNLQYAYSLDNMFANDTSLTDIDVSKMDVSKVQSMKYMFANTKISNLDLSTWQAPRVITIGMLSNTPITVISLSNNISIQGSELSPELKGYKNTWKIVGNGTIDKP